MAEEADRERVLGVRNPLNASAGARGRPRRRATARGQNDAIRGALETVRDTEQTAIDIADELGRNRDTIGSIRGHVADAGGDLGAARGLIGRMQRREVQQKAVLTVVAAILIAAIGTVSYALLGAASGPHTARGHQEHRLRGAASRAPAFREIPRASGCKTLARPTEVGELMDRGP